MLHHWLVWLFIVAFGLNKKVSCDGLSRGEYNFEIHLYLKNDSKKSYIMFLHDYLLACQISTVRILALKYSLTIEYYMNFYTITLSVTDMYQYVGLSSDITEKRTHQHGLQVTIQRLVVHLMFGSLS